MNLNSIIFPAPTEDKTHELYRYKDEIIYIPKMTEKGEIFHIPCLVQESKKYMHSNKYLFYFHGNAEDIFNSTNNLDILRNSLPFNTVAIEYPGYSIYYKEKSADMIEKDSLTVYDYFVNEIGIDEKDIIICGRSIGSGPAVHLASNRNPGAIILISPFKSIQETASSILGMFKFIVKDRFNNLAKIKKVTCPLLLIHGQKDNLIPFSHSLELAKNTGGPYDILLPEEMDHNEFDLYEDYLEPISSFLKRHYLILHNHKEKINIKNELFEIPDYLIDPNNDNLKSQDYMSKFLRKMLKI